MLYTFAHAGQTHDMGSMTTLDHCMPIMIGAGIVIAMLVAIIIFLLVTWQPKTQDEVSAPKKRNAKKS
jgi:hypothetical protein